MGLSTSIRIFQLAVVAFLAASTIGVVDGKGGYLLFKIDGC
jgi:hypothetical protein